MARLANSCLLLTLVLVGCSPRRCAKGEVPNDTLQACVILADCDGGMVDARNECVTTDAGDKDKDRVKREGEAGREGGRAGASGSFDPSGGGGAAGTGDEPRGAGGAGAAAGSRTVGDGGAGSFGLEAAAGAAGASGPDAAEPGPRCGDGRRDPGEKCDGDCPAQCMAMSACMQQELVGAAAQCSAECQSSPITACAGGDGCCPSGCTHALDSDCSATCGDGALDPGEKCEPGNAAKPCPTSCADTDPCTADMLVGAASSCSAECVHVPITAAQSGDACCPQGADATMDSDCKPRCGNGVLEVGEKCDGDCPTASSCSGGSGCSKQMLSGSGCNIECKTVEITSRSGGDGCCPPGASSANDSDCQAVCGNGVREAGEKCDGDCPTASSCSGGSGCSTHVLSGSGCDAECKTVEITESKGGDGCCPQGASSANDSDCQAVCGNGVREAGEKCDGDCPTASSCSGGSGCSKRVLSGSGCNVECKTVDIKEPKEGDQCCPPGANPEMDSDCPTVCGDGAMTGGEQCDPRCAEFVHWDARCETCPTSCDDHDPSTVDTLRGSGCQSRCDYTSRTGTPSPMPDAGTPPVDPWT